MDKIIDALDGHEFYERIKNEYKLKTSYTVLNVIVETGFLVDPCEDTLQACVRLVKKYSGEGFPSDLGDYYRATPLLILMGYYDTLPRGFVSRCLSELFETKDSWSPRPYVLHCDHEIEFLDVLWRVSDFQRQFNNIVYLMQNKEDRDVMKRLMAFRMREAKIIYKMYKNSEKLEKISI